MTSSTALLGMLKTDGLRILRDRFLIGITLYLLFIFVAMRVIIPWITAKVASSWNFDLIPYYPLIISHVIVQLAPLAPGIVGGFLLLESREEGTAKALLVSPNPLSSYLSVICVVMVAISIGLTVAAGTIIGLSLPSWPALIVVAIAAAPAAPMFALAIAAIANNKVQAFVWLKIFGLGPMIVVGAWFLPEAWQLLAAIYPPYWASKAFWVAESGGAWPLWTLGGLITSVVGFVALRHVFLRAARR